VITIFILIDAILTAIGLKIFFTRIIYENDLKVKNASNYTFNYDNLKKK
jgi:fatty-acid desaturase